MTRRWALLTGALALGLSVPQAAFATPHQPAAAPDPAATALRALKAHANGVVRVHRGADGDVALVRSANGRAMLDSDTSSPRRSVQDQLAQYGEAFGIDGDTSKAVVTQTIDSATGGSVVRADQVVDGVPVFGGQIVMSLDQDQGVVSVASATTNATQVPAAEVSEADAQRNAVAATAKSHAVPTASLSVTTVGRRFYDPAIVHTADPLGARPVWQFQVTNGSDIRETVLVGTGRGEIALHFNDAPEINRRICDNKNVRTTTPDVQVPICSAAARVEGGAVASVPDVNQAYDNLGATSAAYADLDAIDLTQLIGATVSGQKTLQSTVRWCYKNPAPPAQGTSCPYDNAFWDGRQMVFGAGYAGADDVVGHELTHGYVERTSALFYLHESGAINESVADIIGEIVDHRNPASPDSDANWTMGEDIPGGALRSLKDPTLYGQPDRMTSPNWDSGDFTDDNGAVHNNNGVGNKTAYLISQGGTFNGQTISGIDSSDPGLAKTGRLYLDVIARLTSAAQYADLGQTLVATCDEFAGAATAGFTTGDCDSVRAAVAATELSSPPANPAAVAPKTSSSCLTGDTATVLARDTDAVHDFGWTFDSLWQRTPANGTPQWSREGTSSLFAWDPDPAAFGDPSSSSATSSGFAIPSGVATYLHFDNAYAMEWAPASGGTPATYYDGGQVLIQTQNPTTLAWTTAGGLPWANGPNRTLTSSSTAGFGGDSQGYGSSRVDLTSLAGKTVRVVLRVVGDANGSVDGWWVDDMSLYSCPNVVDSAPAAVVSAGTTTANVSWTPPDHVGSSPIASYRISRSDGPVRLAPASDSSITLTGLPANNNVTVSVAAVNEDGQVGPASSVPILATTNTVTAPTSVVGGRAFTLSVKVTRRGSSTVVPGMPVTLQRHVKGETTWRTVSSGPTSTAGTRAWSLKQSQVTYYRVVSSGLNTWLGSTSATRTVSMR